MPDVEGLTCTACLTLNPVGAPSCVRCNTPLRSPGAASAPAPPAPAPAPAPATGPPAGRMGPGLALPPRGTAGSSVAAATPVQPPGYGTLPEGDRVPPPQPAFTPGQQRRIRRRIAIVGSLVVLLVLAGGGAALWQTRPRYVDTAAVASRLGQELSARLGEPVTVECRGSAPRRRAGEMFGCAATNAQGVRQTIVVTIVDRTGRYRWRLG